MAGRWGSLPSQPASKPASVLVRESVLPTAREGELKMFSGTAFAGPLPELIVEENCWFRLQMGVPAQPASQLASERSCVRA